MPNCDDPYCGMDISGCGCEVTDPKPEIREEKDAYAVIHPWEKTGETKLEYCRRVSREGVSQKYRLHIKDDESKLMISDGVWGWRMTEGASVSVDKVRYRVKRITPHPALVNVDIVWVDREK